jgi:hypothetical protein
VGVSKHLLISLTFHLRDKEHVKRMMALGGSGAMKCGSHFRDPLSVIPEVGC